MKNFAIILALPVFAVIVLILGMYELFHWSQMATHGQPELITK